MCARNYKKKILFCSFCNKSQKEVKKMIHGRNVVICDECIDLCCEIILYADESKRSDRIEDMKLPRPIEISEALDDYVVRQNDTKRTMSVAIYNHYRRLKNTKKLSIKVNKSNILLIGPSGCGKTLLAETLARYLDVPFVIADATTFTEVGYVGEDVESIIQRLFQKSENSINRTQRGIVYIDEIDKICKKNDNFAAVRDVSGEGVQQALLKLVEGTLVDVTTNSSKKHVHQDEYTINTSEILFICGGTFVGLDSVISQRMNRAGIGFSASLKSENELEDVIKNVEPDDLVNYGLIPEFIGRFPIVSVLSKLDEEALVDVLIKPKNALLKQYTQLFDLEDVSLEFSMGSLSEIAKKSSVRDVGARGLRSVLEDVLSDTMYNLPSIKKNVCKVVFDEFVVRNNSKPIYIMRDRK